MKICYIVIYDTIHHQIFPNSNNGIKFKKYNRIWKMIRNRAEKLNACFWKIVIDIFKTANHTNFFIANWKYDENWCDHVFYRQYFMPTNGSPS